MNKSELIDSIADKSGLNKTQAGDALNAVMESVGEALEAGDSISLVGFGTFSTCSRTIRTISADCSPRFTKRRPTLFPTVYAG